MINTLRTFCIFFYGFLIQQNAFASVKPQYSFIKIINGAFLDIRSRPYMVSISASDFGFLCGGSIISVNHVLTAYHCLPDKSSLSKYWVRSGSSYRDTAGALHSIAKIFFYSDEIHSTYDIPKHDIMILKVKPQFRISATTLPAKLPLHYELPPDNLWVTGWGKTQSNTIPRELHMATVKKVSLEVCSQFNSMYKRLIHLNLHLCYGIPGFDSCQGDSGGPLGDVNKVYGIVSFGYGCGIQPGVYVRVARYTIWIKNILTMKTLK